MARLYNENSKVASEYSKHIYRHQPHKDISILKCDTQWNIGLQFRSITDKDIKPILNSPHKRFKKVKHF